MNGFDDFDLDIVAATKDPECDKNLFNTIIFCKPTITKSGCGDSTKGCYSPEVGI